MKVIIDTNIICSDFQMRGSNFKLLFKGLETGILNARLYIPQIVFEEVMTKYEEKIMENNSLIKKATSNFNRITGKKIYSPLKERNINKIIKDYKVKLKSNFKQYNVEILSYPEISHEKVVSRALNRKKPFTKDGKEGYRDYIIWENALQIAKTSKVIFITDNVRDFAGESNKEFHPDLVKDIDEKAETELYFYRSLADFNNKFIKPKIKSTSSLSNEIKEVIRKKILSKESYEKINSLLNNQEVYYDHKNIIIDSVEEISNIKFRDKIYKLSQNELIIELNLFIKCNIYLKIKEAQPTLFGEEIPAELLSENEITKKLGWAEQLKDKLKFVKTQISLIFNTSNKNINSLELNKVMIE